ncbi:MAG TPA: hydantoinase/oxoprolinase family protein [Acidimicrobiales bacterium]|nr:hydantoinase/oxoprolinase family protein [Acidimicrobiales bacterium]
MTERYRIGVDVGGTFTDCVLLRPDGTLVLEKTPTTPADQSAGVLEGLRRLAVAVGHEDVRSLLERSESIVHGTTTADNTMIQMSGAPTGLIVTEGYRDEIELRRCFKEDIWDPALEPPPPIARRRVRLEVAGRLTAEGDVDVPLDEEAVRKAVARLRAFGVTSIAVTFLYSFLNPDHELKARDIILDEYPDVELISLSHEVYSKPPEFERTSTTLVNAYVGPPIVSYLHRLEAALADAGFSRELLLATCSGGVATPDDIRSRPLLTMSSGPTGGVVAAARAAARAGMGDVVSVDMGGTSYDVCLIRDGRPDVTANWNWRHRYCVALPMVDIHAIGAGGGSLIDVVDGVLRVGPESAGSTPGPVCYGNGGIRPAVTDADLVLGRLDPTSFWGGRLELDVGAARRALAEVGRPLGLDSEGTARAAVEIVDAHMADAVRRVLSLAGSDPRTLDLVAFGGMGAVHAARQGALLGMRRVLIPEAAPAFSALGLLTADHVIDDTRTIIGDWRQVDLDVLTQLADDLEASATAKLELAGVDRDRRRYEWLLNLVYPGQTFDVAIPVEREIGAPFTRESVGQAAEELHHRNEAARLIETRSQEPVVRGVRLVATGLVDQPEEVGRSAPGRPRPLNHRRVYAGDRWVDDAPVFHGGDLGAGSTVPGPALIQSPFTTVVLAEGDTATMLASGDLLVDVASR